VIRLLKNYAMDADEHQYVLYKVFVAGPDAKKPRVPGEEYAVADKYYPTVGTLLQALVNRLQREAVASGEATTLQEAATVFKRIEANVRALIIPGEEVSP
jgi:hypothetical protein